eukprot:364388-Chlamydomonas_euryale.AAC.3
MLEAALGADIAAGCVLPGALSQVLCPGCCVPGAVSRMLAPGAVSQVLPHRRLPGATSLELAFTACLPCSSWGWPACLPCSLHSLPSLFPTCSGVAKQAWQCKVWQVPNRVVQEALVCSPDHVRQPRTWPTHRNSKSTANRSALDYLCVSLTGRELPTAGSSRIGHETVADDECACMYKTDVPNRRTQETFRRSVTHVAHARMLRICPYCSDPGQDLTRGRI